MPAKRKPKIPQGWKAKEYTRLKKDIANYNKRIRRAKARGTGDYIELLPQTTTVREMLALGSKRDIKKAQKDLKLYNAKTLKPTLVNTLIVPAFQAKTIRKNLEKENQRRAALRSQAEQAREGRFPSQTDADLRELQLEDLTPDRLRELADLDYTPVVDQRAISFQQNYLNSLNELESRLLSYNMNDDELEEALDLLRQIRDIVESITPSQFYLAQIKVPNASIQVISDFILPMHDLAYILTAWEGFRQGLAGS